MRNHKIGQSSHKMYSNNIVNFQESTTILNACIKKSGSLLNAPHTHTHTHTHTHINIYIYISLIPTHWSSRKRVRQWPGRPGFNPRSSHTKDLKMVLDAALLNIHHYKVWIKGKAEQSRKRSSPLEKGALGSPTLLLYIIMIIKSY